jgi:nucleoid-associated protein YgaU
MQKIERYGVIALVFLLVTILAVSLWGESKDGGLFFWKKDAAEPNQASAERPRPRLVAGGGQGQVQGQGQGQGQRGALGAAARNEAAQQRAAGGGLELSRADSDPVAAQFQQERLAQLRRNAQAADGSIPTPGGNLALPQSETDALLGGQPVATQAELNQLQGGSFAGQGAGQANTPAVPVGPRTLVRPAPSEPVAARVPAGSRGYVIRPGDTLGEIARRELGSSTRWTEIQALNGNLDPKRLHAGVTIALPVGASNAPRQAAAKTAPASGGPRTYSIRSGDTLSAIALRELGSAERWSEIAALNPSVDPARLSVGASIQLPAGASRSIASTPPAAAPQERRNVVAYGTPTTGKSKVQ